MQSTFELTIKNRKEEKEEEKVIQVRLNEPNPFVATDIICECSTRAGAIKAGSFVKACIDNEIIISPKNLVQQIEEYGDFEAVTICYKHTLDFINNPRIFTAKKIESDRKGASKVSDMADNI